MAWPSPAGTTVRPLIFRARARRIDLLILWLSGPATSDRKRGCLLQADTERRRDVISTGFIDEEDCFAVFKDVPDMPAD